MKNPLTSFGSVILDYDRSIDIFRLFKTHGDIDSCLEQPFALHLPVALPGQDASVAECGNCQGLELLYSQVLYKRAMGDYDDVLVHKIICIIQEVPCSSLHRRTYPAWPEGKAS